MDATMGPAETPAEVTNRVVIVGVLGASRRGSRDGLPALERRNAVGAAVRAFRLETASAFGEEVRLDLEASPQVEGVELLVRERVGLPLAIEGLVRREVERDRRYATTEQSIGERVVTTGVQVTRVRELAEGELCGTAVWLAGEVAAEPRFGPHRLLPGMLLARTVLRVVVARPSGVPGSRAVVRQPIDVGVVVPIDAAGARALYRPGNRVQVEGQLDVTLIPQGANPRAQARLRQLDEEWAARREALVGDEAALRAAVRQYRGQRAPFVERPLLAVVAGAISLLAGDELGDAEARELTARADSERRRRRIAGGQRGRLEPREPEGAPVETAESEVAEAVEAAEEVPAEVERVRPRRRRAEAETEAGAEAAEE